VKAHGGRIWAENATDGGARFTFTLPLASAAIPGGAGLPQDDRQAESAV
jgi:K+-sensing histidine kinase KdpD